MSAERITAFIGSHELDISSTSYTINNETIVNTANIQTAPDDFVTTGAVVDVKRDDESTTVFSGQVHNIEETTIWDVEVASNGYELINTWVEKVYQNISPEDVIADIVDNFTTKLTYTGTQTSGVVLDEYLAQGYAIDIIRHMLETLRWRLVIDQNDNVEASIEGSIDNGRVFTNGENINITSWQTTDDNVINQVRLEAGFLLPRKIQTYSQTGTIFELENKPESSVRVVVSGSEVSSDDYKVEPENNPPRIVFDSSVTDPTIEYTWRKRIIVEDQDEDSITQYGIRFDRVDAPYIISEPDALRFARSIIQEYKDESVFATGVLSELNFDIQVNERVTFVDPLRNKTVQGVINQIKYEYDTGQTVLNIGPRNFDFVNWQNGVQDRIKQIERRFSSSEQKVFVRSTSPKIQITVEWVDEGVKFFTPNNTLIADHITLGYARTDENMEVDCSPANEAHGTWQGTTIDGDQYVKEGYRLYCAEFNGAEYVSTTETLSDVRSVCVYIKDEVNDRPLVQLASGVSIGLDTNGDIETTGLSNVEIEESTVAGWRFINVNFDAITIDDLMVGRVASSYYEGLMDEFCLFDKVLDADDRLQIVQKRLDRGTDLYDNHCVLYWSFDHPLAGDFEEEL